MTSRASRGGCSSFGSFAELAGGPGFVLIDLRNKDEQYYGHAVSVLPYASGKYYHWRPDYLCVILEHAGGHADAADDDLGRADSPRGGRRAPTACTTRRWPTGRCSRRRTRRASASRGTRISSRGSTTLSAAAGGSVSEVCAESWPGQNMIDSCIDCVDSWRHSSGHWQGVSRPAPGVRLRHPPRPQRHLVRHGDFRGLMDSLIELHANAAAGSDVGRRPVCARAQPLVLLLYCLLVADLNSQRNEHGSGVRWIAVADGRARSQPTAERRGRHREEQTPHRSRRNEQAAENHERPANFERRCRVHELWQKGQEEQRHFRVEHVGQHSRTQNSFQSLRRGAWPRRWDRAGRSLPHPARPSKRDRRRRSA